MYIQEHIWASASVQHPGSNWGEVNDFAQESLAAASVCQSNDSTSTAHSLTDTGLTPRAPLPSHMEGNVVICHIKLKGL